MNAPTFQDRRTGLRVAGAFQIALGGLSVMLVLLALVSLLFVPDGSTARLMLPSIGIYVLTEVVFISLGIGSILARRWARALSLIVFCSWLIIGFPSMFMLFFVIPNLESMGSGIPREAAWIVKGVMLLLGSCLYIVVPGTFWLFYRSPHVKATCEHYDPVPRWTDRCPLPVLAWSLILAVFAPLLFIGLAAYNAFPAFGTLLTGLSAAAMALTSAVMAALSFGCYLLKPWAWWGSLAWTLTMGVSTFLSMSRENMMAMYDRMDLPEAQTKLIFQSPLYQDNNMMWMTGIISAGYLVFVLFLGPYFKKPPAGSARCS